MSCGVYVAHRAAFRGTLIVYGVVFCGGLIPLQLWLMPNEPFSVGEVCCKP